MPPPPPTVPPPHHLDLLAAQTHFHAFPNTPALDSYLLGRSVYLWGCNLSRSHQALGEESRFDGSLWPEPFPRGWVTGRGLSADLLSER